MHLRHDHIAFLYDLVVSSSAERHAHHIRVVDVLESISWFERETLEYDSNLFGYDSHTAFIADIRAIRKAFLNAVADAEEYVQPDFTILDDAERHLLGRIMVGNVDLVFERYVNVNHETLADLAETAEHLPLDDEGSEAFTRIVKETHHAGARLHEALHELSDVPERQRVKTEAALLAYAIRRLADESKDADNAIVIRRLVERLQALGL